MDVTSCWFGEPPIPVFIKKVAKPQAEGHYTNSGKFVGKVRDYFLANPDAKCTGLDLEILLQSNYKTVYHSVSELTKSGFLKLSFKGERYIYSLAQ